MPIFASSKKETIQLTITLDAYTAGDVVGGLITIDTANAGGGGIFRSVTISDGNNQKEAYTLYIFDGVPATIADDAAFVMTETASPIESADHSKLIGTVDIAADDYTTLSNGTGSVAYAVKNALELDFATGGKCYAYLVAVDTPDYAAVDDLILTFRWWSNA